ncbi:hypothetical protein [Yersinia wautersii]|nr:hypothetical protein [Yersinia wautersii]
MVVVKITVLSLYGQTDVMQRQRVQYQVIGSSVWTAEAGFIHRAWFRLKW